MLKNRKLRIAMVAPPFGDNGGPEIVTQNLTDALLRLGADVTLFAPADWKTKAQHVPTLEQSLWNMKNFALQDKVSRRNLIISSQTKVLSYQDKFDIIHLHSQKYAYTIAASAKIPCVLSFHNKINEDLFCQLKKTSIFTVSLSNSQKGLLKTSAMIYSGIPLNNIVPSFDSGKYLIAIGRLAEQKGIDTAIQIARKAAKKLLIFGRIGNSQERQHYFNKKINPFIDGKNVIYKGEVSNKEIYKYLRDAEALLFTIKRPEVFGLVAIEALASGTPVIGTKIAPLPEFLIDPKTSFLSNNLTELISAAKKPEILFDRKKCRQYAENNFDSLVMAKKYLKLYKKILKTT
ncbi:MAG TPA: glycosyltransferase [Candidatus Moranbacteria bacterium]|nr:glycosyltransferase [Candidatus Moranbacteria bacterium]